MLSLNQNKADNTINIFEQELISCFDVHHATGKKRYPYELKEMIFKAFHKGMSLDKVIKITKVPAYII
jgi:hypothetical protein